MRLLSRIPVALLLSLLLPLLWQGPAQAQEVPKPVMQNVFVNVVWGSAFGATLGVAVAVIGSSNTSSPSDVRSNAFSGATAGGLIGLGLALYFVYQGITFDPATSTFTGAGDPPALPPVAQLETPPFTLLTSPSDPHRITGFAARVVNLKF
jgi:hypothetical protein